MNKTEKLKNLREKLHILENHNTGLRERIKRKNEEISQLNRTTTAIAEILHSK